MKYGRCRRLASHPLHAWRARRTLRNLIGQIRSTPNSQDGLHARVSIGAECSPELTPYCGTLQPYYTKSGYSGSISKPFLLKGGYFRPSLWLFCGLWHQSHPQVFVCFTGALLWVAVEMSSTRKRKAPPLTASQLLSSFTKPLKKCDRRGCDHFSAYPFCFVQATDKYALLLQCSVVYFGIARITFHEYS